MKHRFNKNLKFFGFSRTLEKKKTEDPLVTSLSTKSSVVSNGLWTGKKKKKKKIIMMFTVIL